MIASLFDDSEGVFDGRSCARRRRSDNAADDHEGGTGIAVFPTVDGHLRYAVDKEGTSASFFH